MGRYRYNGKENGSYCIIHRDYIGYIRVIGYIRTI